MLITAINALAIIAAMCRPFAAPDGGVSFGGVRMPMRYVAEMFCARIAASAPFCLNHLWLLFAVSELPAGRGSAAYGGQQNVPIPEN